MGENSFKGKSDKALQDFSDMNDYEKSIIELEAVVNDKAYIENEKKELKIKNTTSKTDNAEYNRIVNIVEIIFLQETWMEIFNQNQVLIESGIFSAGQTKKLVFDEQNIDFIMNTGNLGGFQFQYNEKFFPPIGKSGEVKKKISLKEEINKLQRKEY